MKKKLKKAPKKAQKKAKKSPSSFKINPTSDRILIREILPSAEEKTASGIIIPGTAEKEAGAKRGVVVTTGPGKFEDGKHIALSVKVGDRVLFQWGEKIMVDGEEYYLVRDAEIMAIVNEK